MILAMRPFGTLFILLFFSLSFRLKVSSFIKDVLILLTGSV